MRLSDSTPLWLAALAASTLGAAILFDASPGINWPIWVAAASLGVILSRSRAGLQVGLPVAILLTWATVLSVSLALIDQDFIHFLVILSDAMLLGLAVISIGTKDWSALSAKLLLTVPFLAPFRVLVASGREAGAIPRRVSAPRARPIVRGALLAVPLVIVLVALLRNADPVFYWFTDRLAALLPDWSFSQRVGFFFFLLALTLGANSIAARQRDANLPSLPGVGPLPAIGISEQRIILGSVAIVLWIFVLLQLSYFFRPPPLTIGSGVTFAEYARRGFGELSFAATIVGAIVIILNSMRSRALEPTQAASVVRLEIALLVALELVLLSAFRKVVLYEQAYGFTTQRLYAQAYMIAMAFAVVALWLDVRRGPITIAFPRRVAEIALGVLTVLALWNHAAWIVERNFDRAKSTGKFDSRYALRLSSDAIPTLISRRAELPMLERTNVERELQCRHGGSARRWFEWNRSVAMADRAIQPLKLGPCVRESRPQVMNPAD